MTGFSVYAILSLSPIQRSPLTSVSEQQFHATSYITPSEQWFVFVDMTHHTCTNRHIYFHVNVRMQHPEISSLLQLCPNNSSFQSRFKKNRLHSTLSLHCDCISRGRSFSELPMPSPRG